LREIITYPGRAKQCRRRVSSLGRTVLSPSGVIAGFPDQPMAALTQALTTNDPYPIRAFRMVWLTRFPPRCAYSLTPSVVLPAGRLPGPVGEDRLTTGDQLPPTPRLAFCAPDRLVRETVKRRPPAPTAAILGGSAVIGEILRERRGGAHQPGDAMPGDSTSISSSPVQAAS
jgi:hypothetical protein